MYVCVCVTVCEECPAGTEPVLGYEYKWWNVLPSNMKTSCFNVGNTKCDDMNGESAFLWEDLGYGCVIMNRSGPHCVGDRTVIVFRVGGGRGPYTKWFRRL